MVILTMGIDQDYVNFYVEILNSGTYEPTNFDLEGFMESYQVEVKKMINTGTSQEKDQFGELSTQNPGTTIFSVNKVYFNTLDIGMLEFNVIL